MKWFKITSLIFLFCLTLYILAISHYSPRLSSPLSAKNNYLSTFQKAINLSGLSTSNLVIRDFIHQIEFKTNGTLVLFSSQIDPYQQVSYLQRLLTLAKIKHANLTRLNLSIKHPYATLQTN
jgi:hypothetical protein